MTLAIKQLERCISVTLISTHRLPLDNRIATTAALFTLLPLETHPFISIILDSWSMFQSPSKRASLPQQPFSVQQSPRYQQIVLSQPALQESQGRYLCGELGDAEARESSDRKNTHVNFPRSNMSSPSKGKGRLIDNVWHCNCTPRLPASHFQVKKETPNKGRWFYTCCQEQGQQCGFFLWGEDAQTREEQCVLQNRRSEDDTVKTQIHTPRKCQIWSEPMSGDLGPATGIYSSPVSQRRSSATSMLPPPSPNIEPTRKGVVEGRNDSAANGLLQSMQKKALENQQQSMATPTPKRKLDMGPTLTAEEQDLFGPATKRRLVFGTPKSAMPDQQSVSIKTPSTIRASEPHTPVTSRTQDSVAPTPQCSLTTRDPGTQNYSLTANILSLLEEFYVDTSVVAEIRSTLNSHCLRVSGIEKGREATRKALKTKDARIEELETKVKELERQDEVNKTIIKSIKRDVAELAAANAKRPRR